MAAAETTAAVVEPAVTVEPVDAAATEAARQKAEVEARMTGFEVRMKIEFDAEGHPRSEQCRNAKGRRLARSNRKGFE